MLEPLPTELVVTIFKLAVEMFRFTDRKTVVHLATVSKMAYDLVTPMLYNTVIFKKSTIASLRRYIKAHRPSRSESSPTPVLFTSSNGMASYHYFPDFLLV